MAIGKAEEVVARRICQVHTVLVEAPIAELRRGLGRSIGAQLGVDAGHTSLVAGRKEHAHRAAQQ